MAKRAWVTYIEEKYAVRLTATERPVAIERLVATQSEIELIKYNLVRHEGYRVDEPILVYKGRGGPHYVVDGHTRARVRWDLGERHIRATVLSGADPGIEAELQRTALRVGGGRTLCVADIPLIDRLGEGSEAWNRRREELLQTWRNRGTETPSPDAGPRRPPGEG